MIRTRVGYCGGSKANPTYHNLGDHSEAIQIDFDPAQISYPELLSQALAQGNFAGSSFSRQYRSVVFYHTPAQRQAAEKLDIRSVEPVGTFTRAEDYHQKYYLQQSNAVKDFYAMFPTDQAFTDSTAVTIANGISGGHVDRERVKALLPALGVSENAGQALLRLAGTSGSGCALPKP